MNHREKPAEVQGFTRHPVLSHCKQHKQHLSNDNMGQKFHDYSDELEFVEQFKVHLLSCGYALASPCHKTF